MARTSNSFCRPKSRFEPQPTVLVICEDSKSGLNYLKDARRYFRVEVIIEISHCGRTDPMGIIEEALKNKNKYDQIYCVIDRDGHPKFNAAIALAARTSNVDVIASFPCFEFWLLLHFGHCQKPYNAVGENSSADLLIKDLRNKNQMMEKYNKGDDKSIFDLLLGDKFTLARKLSPIIFDEALVVGDLNPSTKLHVLLTKFEELSSLKPIV